MKKNIHFRRIPDYIEQELRNIHKTGWQKVFKRHIDELRDRQ